ncbi:MAG TPA: hypothetical protein VL022_10000 [Moheibacter sp.]|nr:hypothetical protein [Moheibacter sp.]
MAQVGVNTENPQTILDVRGDMTVRNKIYVGGNDNLLGNHGKKGQVLVSQGPNKPPMWKTLNIPNYKENEFYMIFTDAFIDNVGLSFDSNEAIGGSPLYNLNEDRSNAKFAKWKDIAGLNKDFFIYNSDNKVYITYEAVVQISGSGSGSVDYACGVFVDNKLQGVRVETMKQALNASNAFQTFLMVIIAEDLTDGKHTTKVSCARIRNNNYTGNFSIGKAIQSNINNFVAQSSLKIEVYEVPENFIPVVD